MSTPLTASTSALKALQSLSVALTRGIHPLQWWGMEISSLPSEPRRALLHELAMILARDMSEISRFAQALDIAKSKHQEEFESVLFDFLLPLHQALIQRKAWNEVLGLEIVVYSAFIKQEEDHDFYESAFSRLYAPYRPILSATVESDTVPAHSTPAAQDSIEGNTLFWFQNYSVLAHTQLVLDLATHLPASIKFYASALSNINLDSSRSTFVKAGIEILEIDDRQNVADRCDALIQLCRSRGVSNIVFVSVPLQSGYLKRICGDIALTWWSMKYPLGCMPHFDRLVCNRTLYPSQKTFRGALWHCAPFALKTLSPNPTPPPLGTAATDLNIGVLSREEKFASSHLPEILHNSLLANPNLHLFWTGRNEDSDLAVRLGAHSDRGISHQVHFAGWVDPATFLTQVDLLVDTPNLGGMVAYWAISMGKVVISATDSGSVGALGSREDLKPHFQLLSNIEEVKIYFSTSCPHPYYLSDSSLIPLCLSEYEAHRELLKEHGQRFLRFFRDVLSDMGRWSLITHQMLKGSKPK
jgi:hypothetical protein